MRVLLATGAMRADPPGGAPRCEGGGLGAHEVAAAVRQGWLEAKPDDHLTMIPVPDGGPGSSQEIDPDRVDVRTALQAPDPVGRVREVDLLGLRGRSGAAPARTWFLDAARLLAPPSDRGRAREHARAGSTWGLGQVLKEALAQTAPGDVLVVGLARSAVHDGGAGMIQALGGARPARSLLAGRELVMALADGVSLGGLGGAGRALTRTTGLDPDVVQSLDRRACTAADGLVRELTATGRSCLPLAGGAPGGAGRLSATGWGTGAAGGAAMVLRALGARADAGPRIMAGLVGVRDSLRHQDLVVTSAGEVFDVPADSVPAVVGRWATEQALPTVLLAGRAAAPRIELAEAGVVACYDLERVLPDGQVQWHAGGGRPMAERVSAMGRRLARSWSR